MKAMITNLLITKYEHKDKSIADRFADFCLTPCRYFLKGRTHLTILDI